MTPAAHDELPHEGYAYPLSHPDNLATIALLKGLEPAPAESCRVLELGCGGGGNLIPMAYGLPDSRFVGIDASNRQIADAQEMASTLGLRNIELKALDLLEVGPELGQFDFIICHGVYSLVPPPVQDKILSICAGNLTLNGVAYVSYSTYPGWYLRGAVAEMLNLHSRRFTDPAERVAQARAVLQFFAEFNPRPASAYALVLREEVERLRGLPDSHWLHEQLADYHRPVYFYQFNEHAQAHGLEYLAEAHLVDMSPFRFDERAQQALPKMSADPIDQEQYMDFLAGRAFRQTLLCQQGVFRRSTDESQFARFQVASAAQPVQPDADLHGTEREEFVTPQGSHLSLRQPLARAALRRLGELWPQAIPFEQLLAEARARRGGAEDAADARTLSDTLFRCFHWGLAELHQHWPRFRLEVSERPVAYPVARYQAERGERVTNVLHQTVPIDAVQRIVLPRLTGQADRAMLVDHFRELAAQSKLRLKDETGNLDTALPQALEECLRQLARAALLIE